MALSLLNYFYWDIPDAQIPFGIADAVLLVALRYVERGMTAEQKLRELEAEHANQSHEMDKAAGRAQQAANRQNQRSNKPNKNQNASAHKNHQIQQPKRD